MTATARGWLSGEVGVARNLMTPNMYSSFMTNISSLISKSRLLSIEGTQCFRLTGEFKGQSSVVGSE